MNMSSKLMKGARTVVKECMKVRSGERVLILTDSEMSVGISKVLVKAAEEVGGKVELKVMEPLERNGQEPSKEIAELMKTPNVLLIPTSKSLTHTNARREATKSGVRIASMPNVSEFSFTDGGLTADYRKVKELCELILREVKNASHLSIKSKNGTDLEMKVGKYDWDEDDGLYHEPGDYGNLPAGEVATAPNDGTTNGILVIDKMGEYGEGLKLTISNGYAEKIEGSNELKRLVNELGRDARNIAEIGIGTNPRAKVIGNVLEDEKVKNTCHIAIGSNMNFGGRVNVPFHVDGVILKPTLKVDHKIIIKDGKWLVQ